MPCMFLAVSQFILIPNPNATGIAGRPDAVEIARSCICEYDWAVQGMIALLFHGPGPFMYS